MTKRDYTRGADRTNRSRAIHAGMSGDEARTFQALTEAFRKIAVRRAYIQKAAKAGNPNAIRAYLHMRQQAHEKGERCSKWYGKKREEELAAGRGPVAKGRIRIRRGAETRDLPIPHKNFEKILRRLELDHVDNRAWIASHAPELSDDDIEFLKRRD